MKTTTCTYCGKITRVGNIQEPDARNHGPGKCVEITHTPGTHWTERSTEDFEYRIWHDFFEQIITELDQREDMEPDYWALTPNRLLQAISFARSVGWKVALVAYDDGDHENHHGPVNADIFRICWERARSPTTFDELEEE